MDDNGDRSGTDAARQPVGPDRPALRHLDVQPARQDGRDGVVLQDPLGISAHQVFVPNGLLPVLARFDGTRSIGEIEHDLRGEGGAPLPPDLVAGLAQQLDDLLFLAGPRFDQALTHELETLQGGGARPARHAGVSAGYPGEPVAARDALSAMLGPRPPATRPTPRGLIAPHIDLARGHLGYAAAYGALAECAPADLYVVFGTGHQGPSAPVTGLPSDWDTPLGALPTDREFVAAIHRRLGPAHPVDLLLHRTEHSLEFQMLFLKHLLGDHPARVAGFLTGHLPHTGRPQTDEPHVGALLAAFAAEVETVRASGRSVCFVAGADLAHLGPQFGDPAPIAGSRLTELSETEHGRLRHLERGDPNAFHRSVEGDGNPDRVCGTTPIFLTSALAGGSARLLHYGQANAGDGAVVVSFCSMIFD